MARRSRDIFCRDLVAISRPRPAQPAHRLPVRLIGSVASLLRTRVSYPFMRAYFRRDCAAGHSATALGALREESHHDEAANLPSRLVAKG